MELLFLNSALSKLLHFTRIEYQCQLSIVLPKLSNFQNLKFYRKLVNIYSTLAKIITLKALNSREILSPVYNTYGQGELYLQVPISTRYHKSVFPALHRRFHVWWTVWYEVENYDCHTHLDELVICSL